MARTFRPTHESAYRQSPSLRARIGKGTQVRTFEIDAVPKAHAWNACVERDGQLGLALFFTQARALDARAAYQREIDACLDNGWVVLDDQPA